MGGAAADEPPTLFAPAIGAIADPSAIARAVVEALANNNAIMGELEQEPGKGLWPHPRATAPPVKLARVARRLKFPIKTSAFEK